MPLKSVVDGILDKHEECEAKKEEERLRKQEEQRLKRELTAKAIQEFILTTVKPVLDEAEMILSERGYKAEVETVAKKDQTIGRDKEYSLGVNLGVSKHGYSAYLDNKLSYNGNFDEETIVVETKLSNRDPNKITPKPISQLEKDVIERDVKFFLEKVFAC